MSQRLLAMIALFVAVRAAVPTPRWKLILHTRDITMWVDSARIDSTRADKMVGRWIRFDYRQPQPMPNDPKVTYARLLVNLAVDCHAETVRNIAMEFVAPSGHSIQTALLPPSQASFTFTTHPFGHGTFIGLCGWLHAPGRFPPVIDTNPPSH